MLRAHDWELFTRCASRSLLDYQPGPGVPRVGIGRPKGGGFDMITHAALPELGMAFEELEAFAVDNLSRMPTTWEVVHENEGTGRAMILSLPDEGALTASRILDRELMRRAHVMLGVTVLFVAVPSLHQLYVCDGSPMADKTLHKAFRLWVERQHAAAEGVDPLSTKIFVLRDGEVAGQYIPPADG